MIKYNHSIKSDNQLPRTFTYCVFSHHNLINGCLKKINTHYMLANKDSINDTKQIYLQINRIVQSRSSKVHFIIL